MLLEDWVQPLDWSTFRLMIIWAFQRKNQSREKALELMTSEVSYKNGATGSRLLSGNHGLYETLEDFLSQYHNSRRGLGF